MTQNLEYEFPRVLRSVLRSTLTDHNPNRVGTYQVFLGNPDQELSKNSYPRIIIKKIPGRSDVFDLDGNYQNTDICRLELYTWNVKGDDLILTIGSSTYSGEKLLDYYYLETQNAIKQNLSSFRTANYVFHTISFQSGLSVDTDPKDDRLLLTTFDVYAVNENINI